VLPAKIETTQHSTFIVRGKKFAYHLVDHHGDDRVSFECKAERGTNAVLADAEPDRFFLPKYMAHHGWLGLWLDQGDVDWDEIEAFLIDAYRLTAPKTLVRTLDV
jgi:hypothetical protein